MRFLWWNSEGVPCAELRVIILSYYTASLSLRHSLSANDGRPLVLNSTNASLFHERSGVQAFQLTGRIICGSGQVTQDGRQGDYLVIANGGEMIVAGFKLILQCFRKANV